MDSSISSHATTHSQVSKTTVTGLKKTQQLLKRKWLPRIVLRLLRDGPLGFSAFKNGIGGLS